MTRGHGDVLYLSGSDERLILIYLTCKSDGQSEYEESTVWMSMTPIDAQVIRSCVEADSENALFCDKLLT